MTLVPTNYEERLAQRVLTGQRAREAALNLFERTGPQSLDEAIAKVCADRRPAAPAFDAIADAWDTYRHLKHLPWD